MSKFPTPRKVIDIQCTRECFYENGKKVTHCYNVVRDGNYALSELSTSEVQELITLLTLALSGEKEEEQQQSKTKNTNEQTTHH